MPQKTLSEIISFSQVASDKFKDEEKIKYALEVKFKGQFENVNKELAKIRQPLADSKILLGLVHEDGDKKGSLRRDEKGEILYSPQVEIDLRNQYNEIEEKVSTTKFDIETYYLKLESKPVDFSESDSKAFEGFIEFQD